MSPTLLEVAVAIVLIVVAWQIGLILAPVIRDKVREQLRALDEASEDVWSYLDGSPDDPAKENDHGPQ
jgi:hypothetical protein